MDKYIKFGVVMEYLRSRNDEARKCGHEETYFDMLTIIDGLKNLETIPASALDKDTNVPTKEDAIPMDWIYDYIGWLNSISTAMAAADVNAIKSMLTKWNLDNKCPVCGPDYCEIGGDHK